MQGVECNGPEKCAEVVCKYFPESREHVVVFDVGTGTGLAAFFIPPLGINFLLGVGIRVLWKHFF
jgi:hypothetical protein